MQTSCFGTSHVRSSYRKNVAVASIMLCWMINAANQIALYKVTWIPNYYDWKITTLRCGCWKTSSKFWRPDRRSVVGLTLMKLFSGSLKLIFFLLNNNQFQTANHEVKTKLSKFYVKQTENIFFEWDEKLVICREKT